MVPMKIDGKESLAGKPSRRAAGDAAFRRQKIVACSLLAAVLLLVGVLAAVKHLVTVYTMTDTYTVDGVEHSDKYYIRKKDGVYRLYDRDGNLMDTNGTDNNVFIAAGSGNQYRIDAESGEHSLYARVDTEDEEALGYSDHILVYPQILQRNIYSIEVTNEKGTYKFCNETGSPYISGFKDASATFDEELYTHLCVSAGYVFTSQKLDLFSDGSGAPKKADGSVDYAAYGLEHPRASFTIVGAKTEVVSGKESAVVGEDGNYIPDPEKTYTILVGDDVLTGSGCYIMLEGRRSVYVYQSELEKTVLQPVEALVKPQAFYPTTVSVHSMAKDFFLASMNNWKLGDKVTSDKYEMIAAFTYLELEYRSNTMDSTAPYICQMPMMSGYQINNNNASELLGLIYNMEYQSCVKLGIDTDVLHQYGLDQNIYYLSFKSHTGSNDENGNPLYVENTVLIGQKTERGTYYVASVLYDMIVEVDQYYLSFLEWDSIEWYHTSFFAQNISDMKELHFTFGDRQYDFTFDNSLTYAYYIGKTYYDASGKTLYGAEGAASSADVLKAINLTEGALFWEGNVLRFRMKRTGQTYDAVVLDFRSVRISTAAAVQNNPKLENVIYINSSGDPVYHYKENLEVTIQPDSTNLRLSSNQFTGGSGTDRTLLDYVITKTYISDNGLEDVQTVTATDNFRNFYVKLLNFSLEGDIDEDEFKKKTGMSTDAYLALHREDADATLSFYSEDLAKYLNQSTYTTEDGKTEYYYKDNNSARVRIRFYRYTDWKAMVTIEQMKLDADGNWVPAEDGVVGKFYVLSSYLEMLAADAQKVLNQEIVDTKTKY